MSGEASDGPAVRHGGSLNWHCFCWDKGFADREGLKQLAERGLRGLKIGDRASSAAGRRAWAELSCQLGDL